MIDRLLRLLEGSESPNTVPSEEDLRIAVAALLVETARMDQSFGDAERTMIAGLLTKRFGLPAATVSSLIERANTRVSDLVQYFPFTRNINQKMTPEEKTELIEMLWRVAYADGVLDPHEDQLIRQIAGLIYVSDHDRMLARKRALRSDS
jgi:uncharacterized tellurite resistance protein B-like protein